MTPTRLQRINCTPSKQPHFLAIEVLQFHPVSKQYLVYTGNKIEELESDRSSSIAWSASVSSRSATLSDLKTWRLKFYLPIQSQSH
jgi:hypothetical protein